MRPAKPSNKTIIRLLIVLGVAALIVFLIIGGGLLLPEEEEALAPPLRRPDTVEYKTHTVARGEVANTVTVRGYFYPEKQVNVAFSNREGFLSSVAVRLGQYVSAGQMLAALDTDTLENEIRRQTLNLEETRETLARLKAVSAPEIARSRLELEDLKKELEIKTGLKETIPAGDLRRLASRVTMQEYTHEQLQLDYTYKIRSAERDIEMAGLKLEELKREREKSILRSPVAGRVVYLAPINPGERVPPYKIMVSVADPHRLIVRYVGNQVDRFRLGMQVTITRGGRTFSGEVVLTPQQVPQEDYEKMKEIIIIRIAGSTAGVNIDDEAMVEATLERAEDVIVLPRRLVHTYGTRSFVKVLEDGLVNERDVRTGIESTLETEITAGLEPGELVVE